MTHSHNSHPLRRQGTSQDTDLLRLRKAAVLVGEWCIQWLSHTQLGCYQTLLSCSVGITNSEWYTRWKHEHIFFVISTNWTMIFWGDGWSIHFFTRNWLLCGATQGPALSRWFGSCPILAVWNVIQASTFGASLLLGQTICSFRSYIYI